MGLRGNKEKRRQKLIQAYSYRRDSTGFRLDAFNSTDTTVQNMMTSSISSGTP
jgi:hypothetical protein